MRHKNYLLGFLLAAIVANILAAVTPVITGVAFSHVLGAEKSRSELGKLAPLFLLLALGTRTIDSLRAMCAETLANRLSRDGREALYLSLLGESHLYNIYFLHQSPGYDLGQGFVPVLSAELSQGRPIAYPTATQLRLCKYEIRSS